MRAFPFFPGIVALWKTHLLLLQLQFQGERWHQKGVRCEFGSLAWQCYSSAEDPKAAELHPAPRQGGVPSPSLHVAVHFPAQLVI